MKVPVTEEGVLIPREWLEGAPIAELKKERGVITVVPLRSEQAPADQPEADRLVPESTLAGLWKHRADLGKSTEYARSLRENAQHREIR
ncbi:MAG: hypothetical protein GVY18_04985 [Bacteroidetes bacterium]|jgi:hypothetical protein|nr:hypothetical protein [Bacteroidota bacterium]